MLTTAIIHAGQTPVVSMSAACQASTEALVRQAQQQLPALAQGLDPHHLQDFLCSMHTHTHASCDTRNRGSGQIVEVRALAGMNHCDVIGTAWTDA